MSHDLLQIIETCFGSAMLTEHPAPICPLVTDRMIDQFFVVIRRLAAKCGERRQMNEQDLSKRVVKFGHSQSETGMPFLAAKARSASSNTAGRTSTGTRCSSIR